MIKLDCVTFFLIALVAWLQLLFPHSIYFRVDADLYVDTILNINKIHVKEEV